MTKSSNPTQRRTAMQKKRIQIFDTTLRDGEQAPGNSMNIDEKLRIAQQLEKLNVDVIEAGFPIASDGDFEAVRLIAQTIKGPQIAGLCRANVMDIDRAWEALQYAGERARIHTFISTSEIHMRDKLKMPPEKVLTIAVAAVAHARTYTSNIEFSFEDAVRSDLEFLKAMAIAVVDAGARVLNIPDTVGFALPEEYGRIFREIKEVVPDYVILSAHCHNDLGLAVANSIAAIQNGAGQVECTINGIGERAGNCSLEELVMILSVKAKYLPFECGVNSKLLVPSSRILAGITGIAVPPNKAIVGANAFAHESGIHQHGVLANPECYEIMTPESVGLNQNKMVLGKHSGRAAIAQRLEQLGYPLGKDELDAFCVKFKTLADAKKEIHNDDILSLLGIVPEEGKYQFQEMSVSGCASSNYMANVAIKVNGKTVRYTTTEGGAVHAIFKCIRRLTNSKARVESYQSTSVTGGADAQGEVTVKLSLNGVEVNGRATATDTLEAAARAYLDALNRLERKAPVEELI